MIVAVDIGNTVISIALVKGKRVSLIDRIDVTLSNSSIERKLRKCMALINSKKATLSCAMICSVVPNKTNVVKRQLQRSISTPVKVVGVDIQVPMINNYSIKSQVGQDRLVGAYAVKELYGFPSIIVDFGTAITFDVVNHRGDYDGGIIVPGIRLSAESLFAKTALLPQIESIRAPRSLIGKNTEQSILSGIFHGYGAMCNGLIGKINAEIDGTPKVIVTGGYTRQMKRFIKKRITQIDPHLVFKGLALIQSISPSD